MDRSVSVIIPTYNYGHFIGEAIESALAQTYAVAEIIVVDSDSTDDTERIVRGFGERVTYIKEQNLGVSAARNKGVDISVGEFIAFLDADDTWHPTKIEKQLAKFADGEVGLVHCGIRQFDNATGDTIIEHLIGGEGRIARDIALWEIGVLGPGSTTLVRREVFDRVGDFDTRLKIGEDWEFCFRVAMLYEIGFVPEVLVDCRVHGKNAHLDVREMERSTLLAWEKVFATEDDSIRALRRRSYGKLHRVLAGSYRYAGNKGGFVRNLAKSLWFRPGYIGLYLSLLLRRSRKRSVGK